MWNGSPNAIDESMRSDSGTSRSERLAVRRRALATRLPFPPDARSDGILDVLAGEKPLPARWYVYSLTFQPKHAGRSPKLRVSGQAHPG